MTNIRKSGSTELRERSRQTLVCEDSLAALDDGRRQCKILIVKNALLGILVSAESTQKHDSIKPTAVEFPSRGGGRMYTFYIFHFIQSMHSPEDKCSWHGHEPLTGPGQQYGYIVYILPEQALKA